MTKPLALVYYENLMPGSQLVNKLQDMNYRVQTAGNGAAFQALARDEKPMLAVVDLAGGQAVCGAIAALKKDGATGHIPVIAFAGGGAVRWMESAQKAGAEVVVTEAAISNHLPEMLDRALHLE